MGISQWECSIYDFDQWEARYPLQKYFGFSKKLQKKSKILEHVRFEFHKKSILEFTIYAFNDHLLLTDEIPEEMQLKDT